MRHLEFRHVTAIYADALETGGHAVGGATAIP